MAQRKKKPCKDGPNCKYKNEYQHLEEYHHKSDEDPATRKKPTLKQLTHDRVTGTRGRKLLSKRARIKAGNPAALRESWLLNFENKAQQLATTQNLMYNTYAKKENEKAKDEAQEGNCWECPQCTLQNKPLHLICECCFKERYSSAHY